MDRVGHPASEPLNEEAFLSELKLMQSVFESVVYGISVSDARLEDFPLIYVNPAFERMTGYKKEEVLGRNCRFLQCGETAPSDLSMLRNAIRQQRDVRIVLKNFTKQGVAFWNELHLSPVFNAAKQLTHYVGIQNDITARIELERRMEYLALHDSLTDLANRSLAMDRLQQSIDRARRAGRMVALIFIDVDDFKSVNDRYGHESGDDLLKAIAARLRLSVRASDCAARIGADEFVVVVSQLSEQIEAEEVKARVISRIEEPLVLDAATIVPRASVGISLFPRDGDSPPELLRAADLAMCLDKRCRSGQAVFCGSEITFPE